MYEVPVASASTLRCPKCGRAVGGVTAGRLVQAACSGCRSDLSTWTFPALAQPAGHRFSVGVPAVEGEALCFFHAEKRAEGTCDRCGRFVCGLCDFPFGTQHLCPACLQSGTESGSVADVVPRRIVWSQVALMAGAWPLILFPLWFCYPITGPAAMALAIYGWKRPGSVVYGRRRWMAVVGLLLGLLQTAIVIGMVILIWSAASRG